MAAEDAGLAQALLLLALKEAVRRVVALAVSRAELALRGEDELVELDDSASEVRGLLQVLELCLWHGLRAAPRAGTGGEKAGNPLLQVKTQHLAPGERHLWDYVLALEAINPAVFGPSILLARMNSQARTPRGLCRAWLRQLLNQNSLEFTLRALTKTAGTVGARYYEDWALLRVQGGPSRTVLFDLLTALNDVGFAVRLDTGLDHAAPMPPGAALSEAALRAGPLVESCIMASTCPVEHGLRTVLVDAHDDPAASGRFVHVEQHVFANKVSGFQLRFEAAERGPCGWGLFPARAGAAPLYFCPGEAQEPPLSGWEVGAAMASTVPTLTRLHYAQGLLAAVRGGAYNVHKEVLLRDELQAVGVEVRQLLARKARLDELRKMDPAEFAVAQEAQVKAAAAAQQAAAAAAAVTAAAANADADADAQQEMPDKVVSADADAEVEVDAVEGEVDAVEVDAEDAIEADAIEADAEDANEEAASSDAPAGAAALYEDDGVAGAESDDLAAANESNISMLSENAEAQGGERENQPESADLPGQQDAGGDSARPEEAVGDGAAAASEGEEEEEEEDGTDGEATTSTDSESSGRADGQPAPTAEQDDVAEAATPPSDSNTDQESTATTTKSKRKKKKKKRAAKVLVADLDEGGEAFPFRKPGPVRTKTKSKTSSLVAATVFDTPKPLQSDQVDDELESSSPLPLAAEAGGDEEETEEERMERFAREEEAMLAEYVAEQEAQAPGDATETQVEANDGTVARPTSDSVASSGSADSEELRGLVREYIRLESGEVRAKEIASEIYTRSGYMIGPLQVGTAAHSRGSGGPKQLERPREGNDLGGGGDDGGDGSDAEAGVAATGPDGSGDNDELDLEGYVVTDAQVAGQYVSGGQDSHVRFIVRVQLERGTVDERQSGVMRGDASLMLLNDEDDTDDEGLPDGQRPVPERTTLTVQRRYNDFKELHRRLQEELGPSFELPALPKTAWVRSFSEDYIRKKRVALKAYLHDLLAHKPLGHQPLSEHPVVVAFLTKDANARPRSSRGDTGGLRVKLITEKRPEPSALRQDESGGLAEQDFKCALCAAQLSTSWGNSTGLFRISRDRARDSARFCSYLERWFCPACFAHGRPDAGTVGAEAAEEAGAVQDDFVRLLPTRVLNHWDFDLYPVCFSAAEYLDSIYEHAVLCVSATNPQLFSSVQALRDARLVRLQLLHAREAVQHCANWEDEDVAALKGRPHLFSDTELYSMRDLQEMFQGTLVPTLMQSLGRLAAHITADCDLCRAQGRICDICSGTDILYPFQITTVVQCRSCEGYFHRRCFANVGGEGHCPRCLRARR